MKKATVAISLISVIAIAIGTWLILSQIHNGENQTPNVKITELKLTSDWETTGGVQASKLFNITIHNYENKDIMGLTVEVKMTANGSKLESATAFFGPGIIGNGAEIEPFDGVLYSGEVRELRGIIMTNWGEIIRANTLGTINTVADVKLDDAVLDELGLP
jgi:hypothetical protein